MIQRRDDFAAAFSRGIVIGEDHSGELPSASYRVVCDGCGAAGPFDKDCPRVRTRSGRLLRELGGGASTAERLAQRASEGAIQRLVDSRVKARYGFLSAATLAGVGRRREVLHLCAGCRRRRDTRPKLGRR